LMLGHCQNVLPAIVSPLHFGGKTGII